MMRKVEPGNETVDCTAGEHFIVELGGWGSSGYEWTITMGGTADTVALVSKELVQPGNADGAVGGVLTERFEFAARQAGRAEIRLDLKRPWEDTIEETHLLKVEVK
jgi:predicted secreted protein